MKEKQFIQHPFPPLFDSQSELLILGSLPSVKSREVQFYYAHPQNRFWKVLYAIWEEPYQEEKEKRISFLKQHKIALWDVIASCEISGSSDASIRNVVPNDIGRLLKETNIKFIFTTGNTAKKYYDRYCLPQTGIEAMVLPSPSPANARMSIEQLISAYKIICTKKESNLK